MHTLVVFIDIIAFKKKHYFLYLLDFFYQSTQNPRQKLINLKKWILKYIFLKVQDFSAQTADKIIDFPYVFH